jgi:hypothetical protein
LENEELKILQTNDGLAMAYREDASVYKGNPAVFMTKAEKDDDINILSDDRIELLITDTNKNNILRLAVNSNGRRFDEKSLEEKTAEIKWNGNWESKVNTGPNRWTAELFIPFSMLKAEGLNKDSLLINVSAVKKTSAINDTLFLLFPGKDGFFKCGTFLYAKETQAAKREESYTVKVYVKKSTGADSPFNITIGDKTILSNNGKNNGRTTIVEFNKIKTDRFINIDIAPASAGDSSIPSISGIDITKE